MKTIPSSYDVTSYLRGLALSVVMANHYVNLYLSDDFGGYGGGSVALFFVLSGYGIFHTLKSSLQRAEANTLQLVLRFYYRRALRILPLYWLFLVVYIYVRSNVPPSSVFLANPAELAPGMGWFVTMIVQCYLSAPILYFLLKKLGVWKYIVIVSAALLATYMVYLDQPLPFRDVYAYRHFFVGQIFLFSLGMALPAIASNGRRILKNRVLLLLSFGLFVTTLYYTRYGSMSKYVAPFFIASTSAFCLSAISTRPKLPLGKIFISLGTYSYPVFLFHTMFYQMLENLGVIEYGAFTSVIFTLLLFPIFFLACVLAEKSINKIVGYRRTQMA